MNDERPNPDALLADVQAGEARAKRGRLKIFFGASAGVGKTFAMLSAARAAQAEGRAVAVGLLETHGRRDTMALAEGLRHLPRRTLEHRGQTLSEFDLDAALAFEAEHPDGVVLVDELAHTNAPGSRHPKRWQDVEELLAAGVDVWSTLNVQHLDSLNDVVGRITGVRVSETVPDGFFDAADEVVVVDLPPDELLLRLKQGKVYLPEQAQRAAANFFRKGNLLALRELALRRTADRVDEQVQAYRMHSARGTVWPNREALLLGLGLADRASLDKLVRSTARLAGQLDVPWHAVHVETPRSSSASDAQRQAVLAALDLATSLGAQVANLSAPEPAEALVRHAREHNLTRVVLGRSQALKGWRAMSWRPSLDREVARLAPELDVVQVGIQPNNPAAQSASASAAWTSPPMAPHAWALAICVATTVAATALMEVLELSSIVLLFIAAVVLSAVRLGRGPALTAAVLAVLLFNFFFVPPRFSLSVADERFWLTFAVMLAVGASVGQLTAGLKAQAHAANEREKRMRGLYDMARDLGSALLPEQVADIAARFARAEFGARSTVMALDAQDHLVALPGGGVTVDAGLARWAFDHSRPAGRGTDTLPAQSCLALPLNAPMRTRGVWAIEWPDTAAGLSGMASAKGTPRRLPPESRQLLDTVAALLAISLERIHYIEVAQASSVQMEGERLRNSLLAAVSHDLRTPLAALTGLAEALPLAGAKGQGLNEQQTEVLSAIRRSAQQMTTLVNNLLDMARLQSGGTSLNKQWQPVEEVIGLALASSELALSQHPVTLQLAPDLPMVELDTVLMERVLVNLLENAAKYTPAGTSIRLSAEVDGQSLLLQVADQGPGLPPGRETTLFDKFARGRDEGATPGVGLGLAICKAIVEAHGGQIEAVNQMAGSTVVGAVFRIHLPLGKPPALRAPGAADAVE